MPDGSAWYFVKDKPGYNRCRTGRLNLVDCVTASAAAPTYFPAWTIRDVSPPARFVDGGVGVLGNPVYQACMEAFWHTGEYQPEETIVVSLGTGRVVPGRSPAGFPRWFRWTIDSLLDAPLEQQAELVHRHFPVATFYRLNPDVGAMDPSLHRMIDWDDGRSTGRLRRYGERFAETVDWNAILAGVPDASAAWHQPGVLVRNEPATDVRPMSFLGPARVGSPSIP